MMEVRPSPFLRALSGEAVHPAPVWLMRQAGRYLPEYRATRARAGGFLELCFTPDLAAEVTLQPIDRFGFDAAILFSDILVVPHALGRAVRFEDGAGPLLDPLEQLEDIDRMSAALADGAIETVLEPVFAAIRSIKATLPAGTPLIGFAGAPWTLATYVLGGRGSPDQAAAKRFAYTHPDAFERLIRVLEAAVGRFLVAQTRAGVDAVKIFDSWAGSLPPALLPVAALDPSSRLLAQLRSETRVPVILFPRAVGARYPLFDALAPDGLALDQTVDPAWAATSLRGSRALQGNLDPVLLTAPPAALGAALSTLRTAMQGRAHILNLGHGVTPDCRIDTIARLLDLWRQG